MAFRYVWIAILAVLSVQCHFATARLFPGTGIEALENSKGAWGLEGGSWKEGVRDRQLPFPDFYDGGHPWATPNSYTVNGEVAATILVPGSPTPPAVPFTLSNDRTNHIWFFNGTSEYQWAFPTSAYTIIGGFCFPIANWNYSMQVAGYNYLQNGAVDPLNPRLFGFAFDITSCYNPISTTFLMGNLTDWRGNSFQWFKSWDFTQGFAPADLAPPALGVGGTLTTSSVSFEALPTSATALLPQCQPGNPAYVPVPYCLAFPLTGLPSALVPIPIPQAS